MRQSFGATLIIGLGVLSLARAQSDRAGEIMAAVRTAIGADALRQVKSLSATGRISQAANQTWGPRDYELAVELPDKFATRQIVAAFNGVPVELRAGFHGDGLIEGTNIENMEHGGAMVYRFTGPGGAGANGTPEELATTRQSAILKHKQDFARIALGWGTVSPAYPLLFADGGQADVDGAKCDVLDVAGKDFSARLFVNRSTHLPIAIRWTDAEPVAVMQTLGPDAHGSALPGVTVIDGGIGSTPEDAARKFDDTNRRKQAAQAAARKAEFELAYLDYRLVDGIRVPFHLRTSINGKKKDDVTFAVVRVNAPIDPKVFETVR